MFPVRASMRAFLPVLRRHPYTREHIRRFGQYVLDMGDLPPPLDPQSLPFETAA